MIKIKLPKIKNITYISIGNALLPPIVNNEPDHIVFTINDTGSRCLIRRNIYFGTLCGYIIVTKYLSQKEINNLTVHGGITFDDFGSDLVKEESDIANHLKLLGNERVIGFDTAHSFDLFPRNCINTNKENTYKDIKFVIKELLKLDKQIEKIN